MSSTYRALCLSHQPALVIGEPEWQTAAELEGVLADAPKHLPEHATCELMGGAYSYPLVRLYCPGNGCGGAHRGRWMDIDWVRLVLAAYDSPANPRLTGALKFVPKCWSYERLDRLRREIGGE